MKVELINVCVCVCVWWGGGGVSGETSVFVSKANI